MPQDKQKQDFRDSSILGKIRSDKTAPDSVLNIDPAEIKQQSIKNLYNSNTNTYYNKTKRRSYTISDTEFFNITDIANGKPGIRHGGKINRQIVSELSAAAAAEGVDLDTALSTAMRESGIGNVQNIDSNIIYDKGSSYSPMAIMQAWDADTGIKGLPMDYQAYRLKHGLVKPEHIQKESGGWFISYEDKDTLNESYINKYKAYIDEFEVDKDLAEPFRIQMRYLKSHQGQKYNPGEKERTGRLAKDLDVIKSNTDLYDYAKTEYDKAKYR